MANSSDDGFPFGASQEQVDLSNQIGQFVQVVVIASLLFYMTGVGVALDVDRFKKAWTHPKPPLTGLFGQIIVNPFMIMGILKIFGEDFNVETKIMGILIAAAPGGNGSALLTYLSYGHTETSIAMTIVSTLFAFGTIPLFVFLGTEVFFTDAQELKVPFLSVFLAALTASLPPLWGIFLQQKVLSEIWIERVKNVGISVGIILSIIAGFLYVADPLFRLGVESLGFQIWLTAFFFNSAALTLGYCIGFVTRLTDDERRAVAFEVGVQNLAIPLAVVQLTFGAGVKSAEFIPFLGVYVIMGFPVNYGFMLVLRYCFPIERKYPEEKLTIAQVGLDL